MKNMKEVICVETKNIKHESDKLFKKEVTSELQICSVCGRPYYKGKSHDCRPNKS